LADAITQSMDHPAENDAECERSETTPAGSSSRVRSLPTWPSWTPIFRVPWTWSRSWEGRAGRADAARRRRTWATPEEGARWIAAGARLALAKPVSPHDLRKACMDLASGAGVHAHHGPLGETTVEQLTTLIVGEIQRGLPGALVQGKSTPIQLATVATYLPPCGAPSRACAIS